jgi:glycosyltransferase involved in cell wall biosynthesis
MSRKKVLYVIHGHPAIRPGGAEGYTLELYEAMRESAEFEPILLARNGPPHSPPTAHEGTRSALVGNDPSQFLFETDAGGYEWLFGRSGNKVALTRYYRDFLLAHKPDIVHFQHTLFMGYDMIRATRRTLPAAAIVYTLHEYLPICHRHGQMVRTDGDELCMEASPRRCHECFPMIPAQEFQIRKQFIQSHFDEVDMFLAPSLFLMDRYVDWGIPPEKIRFEEYGRRAFEPIREADGGSRRRNRFGYFGQFSHYKGVNVLLKAMAILAEDETDARLWLHGANLDIQPQDFQDEFKELLKQAEDNVFLVGRYEPHEQRRLMAAMDWVVIPSRWWENSPLVIQEAFAYGRPVICSDIGGMAEKVTDGVNGLHFRVGDPVSLAQAINKAVTTPGLWSRLRSRINPPYRMEDHTAELTRLYTDLLERARVDGRAKVEA